MYYVYFEINILLILVIVGVERIIILVKEDKK